MGLTTDTIRFADLRDGDVFVRLREGAMVRAFPCGARKSDAGAFVNLRTGVSENVRDPKATVVMPDGPLAAEGKGVPSFDLLEFPYFVLD